MNEKFITLKKKSQNLEIRCVHRIRIYKKKNVRENGWS